MGMSQDTDQPTENNARINFFVPIQEKQRLREIAHERTVPGKTEVGLSDVMRDAVRMYLSAYGDDEMPDADPETNGRLFVEGDR